MSARKTVGFVLIVLGIVALALGGISWTHEKTVVDTGPLKIQTQEHKRIPLPPVLGGLALVGGIVLLAIPDRRRT